jgi:hypothetical protein
MSCLMHLSAGGILALRKTMFSLQEIRCQETSQALSVRHHQASLLYHVQNTVASGEDQQTGPPCYVFICCLILYHRYTP